MRRLLVLCEGYTELEFVHQVLAPEFLPYLLLEGRLLSGGRNPQGGTAKGGIRSYQALCHELQRIAPDVVLEGVFLTTMFDFYQLPTDYPQYQAAILHSDPWQKVRTLEDAIQKDWKARFSVGYKFIPYIQLHEFEALLFTDIEKLDYFFIEDSDQPKIQNLMAQASLFKSPEEINQGTKTAPSKRILQELPRYQSLKVIAGVQIAQEIGITAMRQKCPHFDDWLSRLENL